MKSIDLAIIGGGCAGLSLARDLALQNNTGQTRGRHIIIFEPRTHYENDRTWCYWSLKNESHDPLVSHRWPAWQFSNAAETIVHRPDHSQYCLITGSDFYADALAAIEDAPNIDFQQGVAVKAVEACPGGFKIITPGGCYMARRVVDTRPPSLTQGTEVQLYQAFAGAEIETPHAVADPEIPCLMANMHRDPDGFGFDYILPLGPQRWLVEATLFSPDPRCARHLPDKLQASLRRLIPNSEFGCLRREQGLIPMGFRSSEPAPPPGWVKAGTGGGAVRAASGYAYRRIQRWSRECARHFTQSGAVIGHPPDPWTQRKMDALFLKVLRLEPNFAPKLFCRLARGLSPDAMARFMMDQASAADMLAVVRALPKSLFLKHLFARSGSPTALPLPKGAA